MDNTYIEAAQRVIERAEARGENAVRVSCEDCKWLGGRYKMDCNNPIVILAAEEQDDANHRRYARWASEQRSGHSHWGEVVCGPNGSLFESRTFGESRGFFDWLFG